MMNENIEVPVTPNEPIKTDSAKELPLPRAEWTIMIYMAGDNNLTDPGIHALADMRESNKENKVHVSVQLDPKDDRMKTRRLVINRKLKMKAASGKHPEGQGALEASQEQGGLGDDAIKVPEGERLPGGRVPFPQSRSAMAETRPPLNSNETDTADPKTLFDFISWTKDNCPAEHYMLVLAGHSAGVEEGFLMKDENPPGSMSFEDLVEKVLRPVAKEGDDGLGMKLDILGLDSCLMNMAEICFELKGLVKFIVGAQGYVPNPGWPYKQIVAALEKVGGDMSSEILARRIVREYIQYYLENAALGGLSVDLGALDADNSDGVTQAVGKLVEVILPKLEVDDNEFQRAIVYAHWAAQSYNGELFVDLHDFCQMLIENYVDAEGKPKDEQVSNRCLEVQKAISRMRVISCFCGIDCQHSNGLSIYFPWSVIFDSYSELNFARESKWFEFLKTYVEKTRRLPRGGLAKSAEAQVARDFLVFEAPFELKEGSRRDPPYGHGPDGHVNSMRNPPRAWTSKGTSQCTENLRKIFESIR